MVHMISPFLGYRSFAESWPYHHYSVTDRANGYRDAMRAAGLVPQIVSHERFIHESEHFVESRAMLEASDRPTAVLSYSEGELMGIVSAAASLNLSIPRDVSVVVFSPSSPWMAGKLVTVVAIPTERMGRAAVRMLSRKLLSPDEECAPEAIPYGLGEELTTIAPPPEVSVPAARTV
jgi:DNA-binding LacI/PurR family transcriptional regulator